MLLYARFVARNALGAETDDVTIAATETTTHPQQATFGAPGTGVEELARELRLATADPIWLTDRAALETRCRSYLESVRWPDGVECPRCSSREVGDIPARRKFYCRSCRYQFSATAGTVFHNSHLPLWKWFLTVALMLDAPSGLPSNQLVRLLGGSYRTAWFAQHRVRAALHAARRHDGADAPQGHAWAQSVRTAAAVAAGDRPDARLFDRSVVGPYHQLSVKYASAYIAEMEWRAEVDRNVSGFRATILALLACDPVSLDELVAGRGPVAA
jgi:transposase-like protein